MKLTEVNIEATPVEAEPKTYTAVVYEQRVVTYKYEFEIEEMCSEEEARHEAANNYMDYDGDPVEEDEDITDIDVYPLSES